MDEREEKAAGMSAAVARCGYLIRYIICYLISYGIRYSPSAATLTDVYTYRYGGAAGAGEEEEEKEDEEKEKEEEEEDEDEEEEEMHIQGTGSVAEPPPQGGASALGAMGVVEGGAPWGRSEAPPHTEDRPGILSTHVPLLQGGSGSGKKRADESERWASMCVNVCVSTNIFV